MTRNIRKIVSIICAVALLLSVSVVSFIGSSSAKVEENGDFTLMAPDEKANYGYSKITHDMETETTSSIRQQGGVKATFVDSDDAAHGKVLQTNSGTRVTFKSDGVFLPNKMYYITFDAKATSGTSIQPWLIFARGNVDGASGSNPRFIVKHDVNCTDKEARDSAFTFLIDGKEVTYDKFNVTDKWQTFTLVFDYTDAAFLKVADKSGLDDEARYFWVGNSNMWLDNLEIVTVDPAAEPGTAIIEQVIDGKSTFTAVPAGVKYPIAPVDPEYNTDPDRGFAGWTDESGNLIDANNYVTVKGHTKFTAKWDATFVKVTFVEGNKTSEPERLAVGIDLKVPTSRPNPYLFFQGWVDANGKVHTKVPGESVTLYAKYNGTYMTFNNVYCAEQSLYTGDSAKRLEITTDPDNASNSVLKITNASGTPMITVTEGDYIGAKPYLLKTNTTYTYSYKYKVEGSESGFTINLVRGDSKEYKVNEHIRTNFPEVPAVVTNSNTDGWVTVTGTFTTGDSHYLERVYWFYQDKLIFNVKSATGTVYVDDLLIAEEVSEAPEGMVGVSFQTNGPKISTVYGVPGEAFQLPSSIVDGTEKVLGWYADKKLTVPYTSDVFPDKDITVYAKWDNSTFVMDIEKYKTNAKNASYEFATRCAIGEDGSNHFLHWDSSRRPDQDNTTKYSVSINHDGVYYRATSGVEYNVTFKYKLLRGEMTVGPVYNTVNFGFSSRVEGPNGVTLKNVDANNWYTASFTFTASCDTLKNYLNFGVAGDGECYFDDITITPTTNLRNIYGSTVYMMNSNGGTAVDPIAGDPGEEIGQLPAPTRPGYQFDAWYIDSDLKTKFNDKVFGEKGLMLYAGWILGKYTESFEEFPSELVASGYKLYNSKLIAEFDKSNVNAGSNSIFRDGKVIGNKALTISRLDTRAITVGKQYTVTFYVKPSNVTQLEGTINLINMSDYASAGSNPTNTEVVKKVGDLKAGQWQRVSYTFTATDKYLALSTTDGNDMYFDNITVTLKGYTGTTTGDSSVSPLLIVMMIIIAAGALTITGKKVFEK